MEKRPDPSGTDNKTQVIRIPEIGLQALNHVQYKTLVPLILKANPDSDITCSEMTLLWDAIVNRAFHFARACEKEAKQSEVKIHHFKD